MSPLGIACFDVFSPLPGDSDVTNQFERLNSIETKERKAQMGILKVMERSMKHRLAPVTVTANVAPEVIAAVEKETREHPKKHHMPAYPRAILIGLDVLSNAVLGGRPYQTLSCRIGESIIENRWAARLPLSRSFIRHCLASVHEAIV